MKTDGVGHFRKLVGWLFERCNNMIVSCVKNERKWSELEGGRDWETRKKINKSSFGL